MLAVRFVSSKLCSSPPSLLRRSSSGLSRVRMGTGNGSSNGASTSSAPTNYGAAGVIDFLTKVHSLKTLKRRGWEIRGIHAPESISDHMHRMSLMALVTADYPGINRDRCIKIAVVHDVAEAIVGDITPSCGIPKEEKRRMEAAAMDELCGDLGPLGVEMRELWEEYEAAETEEAKLVKDFDKVEMILQAFEYEQAQGHDLEEFFQSTAGKFQTAIGKEYAREVCSRRAKTKQDQSLAKGRDQEAPTGTTR